MCTLRLQTSGRRTERAFDFRMHSAASELGQRCVYSALCIENASLFITTSTLVTPEHAKRKRERATWAAHSPFQPNVLLIS